MYLTTVKKIINKAFNALMINDHSFSSYALKLNNRFEARWGNPAYNAYTISHGIKNSVLINKIY